MYGGMCVDLMGAVEHACVDVMCSVYDCVFDVCGGA